MFISGNYEVKETKSAFVISIAGEDDRIRITKKQVENVFSYEEPEMVAILLGVIELARHNVITPKNDYNKRFVPERIIENEDERTCLWA